MSRVRRRKSRRTRAKSTQAGIADTAVLLVHGVGHQQHGSLLERMAAPCIDAFECIAGAQGYDVSRHSEGVAPGASAPDSEPRSMLVTLVKGSRVHRVLFVEAVWSDCFTPPSRRYRLSWALRSLPAALLLLAPDQRDAEALRTAESMPKPWSADEIKRAVAKALRLDQLIGKDELVLVRLAWRVFVGALVMGLLVTTLGGIPVIVLLLVAVCYLASRRNVIGHVAMAASADPELDKIRDRVRHCLEWSRRRSRRVVLVAHSQGGFIAHSLLSQPEGDRPVAGLIGVGSGLKPIWLLRQLNDRAVLLLVWLVIGTVVLGEAIALPMVGGLTSTLAGPIGALMKAGGVLAVPPIGQHPNLLHDLMRDALDVSRLQVIDPWAAFGRLEPWQGVLAVPLAGGVAWARRLCGKSYPDPDTAGLAPVRAERWIELSSYHDPVGRMLLPRLPAPAEEQSIAVGGHPVLDHVAYFSPASILPWRVAGLVLSNLGIPSPPAIATIGRSLQADAARRRRLRAGLLMTVIAVGVLPALGAGRSLFAAIAGMAAVLLATSIASSVVFTLRETAAQKSLLATLRATVSTGRHLYDLRQPVALKNRVIPTMLLLMVVLACFLTSLHLTRYPTEQSSSAGPLLLFATVALAYLLAVGAGYRPRRTYLLVCLAVCWVLHLEVVPPVPHEESVPSVLAVPGVFALAAATMLCGALFYWLSPKRLA